MVPFYSYKWFILMDFEGINALKPIMTRQEWGIMSNCDIRPVQSSLPGGQWPNDQLWPAVEQPSSRDCYIHSLEPR